MKNPYVNILLLKNIDMKIQRKKKVIVKNGLNLPQGSQLVLPAQQILTLLKQ